MTARAQGGIKMADRKIRMATSDLDQDQGHTIVGGRPQASRGIRNDIPRALEILVKRAAIDKEFRAQLLQKREKIAKEMRIPLDPSEKAILAGIPEEHLQKMIQVTEVPPAQKNLLAKGTAAAMLALLAQLTFAPLPGHAEKPPTVHLKKTHDRSELDDTAIVKGIRHDFTEDHLADRGIRPDFPQEIDLQELEVKPGQNEPASLTDQPELLPEDDEIIFPGDDPDGIASSEPTAPEFAKVVTSQVNGQRLAEVFAALERDTGIKVEVKGLQERLADYTIESDVSGLPFKMAVETICLETSSEACEFEILWKNDPPAVSIIFSDAPEHDSTGNNLAPLPAIEPQDDSAIIRGIRSDFPEIKSIPLKKDKD